MVATAPNARKSQYFVLSQILEAPAAPSAVAYSPDGSSLAIGSDDNLIRIWKDRQGKFELVQEFEGHTIGVKSVYFSPNGHRLAAYGSDHTVRIWNDKDGKFEHVQTIQGYKPTVGPGTTIHNSFFIISRDWSRFAFARYGGNIRLWEDKQGRFEKLEEIDMSNYSNLWSSLAFSPDAHQLAVASRAKGESLRILESKQGKFELGQKLKHPGFGVRLLAFSASGHHLVAGSRGHFGTDCIWGKERGKFKKVQSFTQSLSYSEEVLSMAFSPFEHQLASGCRNHTIILRTKEQDKFELTQVLEGHTQPVRSLAYSPNGSRLASCSYDKTIRIWKRED